MLLPPLKTFIIYARADAEYKKVLRRHLTPLERQGLLEVWDDAHLLPGEEWEKSIENRLDESDLVLMLVSVDSLYSDFIQNNELKKTLERKKQGVTQFIPILVRDCIWDMFPELGGVQMLPLDGQRALQPIALWSSPDSAWTAVMRELRSLIPGIQRKMLADREAQEAASHAEKEAMKQREAAEKIEKQRFRRDEAAWVKVQAEVANASTPESKIDIYAAYLEEKDTNLNHRDEAEEAVDKLQGELSLSQRLAEKKIEKSLDTQRREEENAAENPLMVLIKGGTFDMGDVMGDNEHDDEMRHQVTVDDFYLGAFPVTFDQYDRFCESTGKVKPSDNGWGRGKHPVININWYDAVEYCNWLSSQHGLRAVYSIDVKTQDPNNKSTKDNLKWRVIADWSANGYRLPAEVEWECAARAVNGKGGGNVRFGNGKDIADPKEMNFDCRKGFKSTYSVVGEFKGRTNLVDAFLPNSLGLYDMSGNVREWCWDWLGIYTNNSIVNPIGPKHGATRVVRGGAWSNNPGSLRCSYRLGRAPDYHANYLGFRLARAAR